MTFYNTKVLCGHGRDVTVMATALEPTTGTLERKESLTCARRGDVVETAGGVRGEVVEIVPVPVKKEPEDVIGDLAILMDAGHEEDAERIVCIEFDHGQEPFAEKALKEDVNDRNLSYYRPS